MTHFVLGYSFTRAERPPSSMYTQLAELSQEHSRASKRTSNTIAPSFSEEVKKLLSRLKSNIIAMSEILCI